MRQEDVELLESEGWIVACESPFELENPDYESTATGLGAEIVLAYYKKLQKKTEKLKRKIEKANEPNF